jgi:hypothetical protein
MQDSLTQFLHRIKSGLPVEFNATQTLINNNYHYTPARFTNGSGVEQWVNEAGSNEGSCRIFYFARLHGLTEPETLQLFGTYYRHDVLLHPEGQDHPNIRQFMKYGWKGIHYQEGTHPCLVLRTHPLTQEA